MILSGFDVIKAVITNPCVPISL